MRQIDPIEDFEPRDPSVPVTPYVPPAPQPAKAKSKAPLIFGVIVAIIALVAIFSQ